MHTVVTLLKYVGVGMVAVYTAEAISSQQFMSNQNQYVQAGVKYGSAGLVVALGHKFLST